MGPASVVVMVVGVGHTAPSRSSALPVGLDAPAGCASSGDGAAARGAVGQSLACRAAATRVGKAVPQAQPLANRSRKRPCLWATWRCRARSAWARAVNPHSAQSKDWALWVYTAVVTWEVVLGVGVCRGKGDWVPTEPAVTPSR